MIYQQLQCLNNAWVWLPSRGQTDYYYVKTTGDIDVVCFCFLIALLADLQHFKLSLLIKKKLHYVNWQNDGMQQQLQQKYYKNTTLS